MALFVGRHINRIDKKGRVSVPRPFRAALQAVGSQILYLYPLFKASAAEACDQAFMSRLSASLDDLDMFSDDQDDLAAIILESAHALNFDTEGRIQLPAEIIEHTSISIEVLFVGRGARFQIWSPRIYESNRSQAFERAKARSATLSLRPNPEEGGYNGE